MRYNVIFAAIMGFLPGIGFADTDCTSWNSHEFFEVASAQDVRACLRAGANIEARGYRSFTPLHGVAA